MLRLNGDSTRARGFSLPLVRHNSRKLREKRLRIGAICAAIFLVFTIGFVIFDKPRAGTITSVASALPPAVALKQVVIPAQSQPEEKKFDLALTKGFRAIAIDVDATSGLEGHALPGSHVDITLSSTRSGEAVTSVIVENARVLSYGGDTRSLEEQRSQLAKVRVAPAISRTITLEMKPIDALQVENARQLGRLGLLMRAPGDIERVEKSEVSATDLGERHKSASPQKHCTTGHATINGANIVIGCDGEISRLE